MGNNGKPWERFMVNNQEIMVKHGNDLWEIMGNNGKSWERFMVNNQEIMVNHGNDLW